MNMIIRLITNTTAVLLAAYLIPMVTIDSFPTGVVVAVVLGAVNMFIKPILKILTFPLTILTLGLFSFVLNALLVYVIAMVVPGFSISGFLGALLFSIVVALFGSFLFKLLD